MSFRNSSIYNSVMKMREFMINDLEKTINLVSSGSGAPNFLLALVLVCYTEYWGRLLNAIAEGQGRLCFDTFFKRLGPCYSELLKDHNIYRHIRCGLAHSGVVQGNATINLGYASVSKIVHGNCGIEYDVVSNRYIFNIKRYFEDFRKAVKDYIQGLESGSENLSNARDALNGKAELL
jgi:hypothetical protein